MSLIKYGCELKIIDIIYHIQEVLKHENEDGSKNHKINSTFSLVVVLIKISFQHV